MWKVDSLEKTLMLGGIGAGREGNDRGWDGWMTSLTQWTWVWLKSGVGDEQGGLACCDTWGCKESDTTERLNWTELKGLISRIQKELVQIKNRKTTKLKTKQKDWLRFFNEGYIKYPARSTLLTSREMRVKTISTYQFTQVRIIISETFFSVTITDEDRQKLEPGILLVGLLQPLRETIRQFLKKVKNRITTRTSNFASGYTPNRIFKHGILKRY